MVVRQVSEKARKKARNYYDHIIRNGRELYRIREYIRSNPAKWNTDQENPICIDIGD